MKVVWRYADILDFGAQSVILAGAAPMPVLCADSWDLHMKVCCCKYYVVECKDNSGPMEINWKLNLLPGLLG